MKKILFVILFLFSILTQSYAGGFGLLKSQRIDGMNKICYYDVLGSTYTLNVKSYELCPLTYNF